MGETCRDAVNAAAKRLRQVSGTARLDAELLMAHALGVERETLLLHRLDEAAPAVRARIGQVRLVALGDLFG